METMKARVEFLNPNAHVSVSVTCTVFVHVSWWVCTRDCVFLCLKYQDRPKGSHFYKIVLLKNLCYFNIKKINLIS